MPHDETASNATDPDFATLLAAMPAEFRNIRCVILRDKLPTTVTPEEWLPWMMENEGPSVQVKYDVIGDMQISDS